MPEYVLKRRLGAGAFGEVWHAHGPGGLDVALKFIPNIPFHELRSLEAMKGIRHPNLVGLFGAWHKDNYLVLAMELCDRTLQDRLIQSLGQDFDQFLDQDLSGIPQAELLAYMSDAADGLDALNAKQVQHRDVKPANLLLLNSRVKVADFGLAKVLEQTVASNSGAGTIAYTAPECFKGKLAQQSDQYSLAVTYYHLRTGELLFEGDQAKIMYAHLESEPDLCMLSSTERAVVARALAKQPDKRWSNCRVFVSELINAFNLEREKERLKAEAKHKRQEQERFDSHLRPQRLWDVVGQRKIVQRLEHAVKRGRQTQEPLEHVLLEGAPGSGKTTLAMVLQNELGTALQRVYGGDLSGLPDLLPFLTNATDGSILFIEEIHSISPTVVNFLCLAMDNFRVDIVFGEGPNARTMSLPLNHFTLIGGTTSSGQVPRTLRDRFKTHERIEPYSVDEIAIIVKASAKKLGLAISAQDAFGLARRSRGNPRLANQILAAFK